MIDFFNDNNDAAKKNVWIKLYHPPAIRTWKGAGSSTHTKLSQESDDYEVHTIKYGRSYSPVLKNDSTAEAKVIVDKDLQIVGAEVYSAEAENIVNMFAFIINKKITLEELDYMIYAFPSSSSVCLYKLHNIHYDL